MKKNMKRFTSMLLTSAMVMGMGLTTLAAPTTQTLTINGVDGHTYEVYQMLLGDVSGLSDGSGTLANIVRGQNLGDVNNDEAKNDADAAAFETAIKGKSGTELSAEAIKYIDGNALCSLATTPDNKTIKQSLDSGYYIVKDVYTDSNKNCAAYMVAVVGDTTMNPKTDTPTLDKNIIDTDKNAALEGANADSKKTDTAAIGDTIEYELTSKVPVTEGYKYYYYVVNDTLSPGLTLNEGSFEVKIGEDKLQEGTGATNYKLYVTKDETTGVTSFKLAIMDMKQFTAGDKISIKYTATVNEKAEIGLTPNTNKVKLQYTNNPEDTFKWNKDTTPENPDNPEDKPGIPKENYVKGETTEKITKTYVTELTIQKVDADSKLWEAALAGAEFTLTGTGLNDVKVTTESVFAEATAAELANTDIAKYYLLKNGSYTTAVPTEDVKDADGNVTEKGTASNYADPAEAKYVKKTVVSVNNNDSGAEVNISAIVDSTTGKITFVGLNAGSYKLEETKVPSGYNKAATLEFTITAAQDGNTTADAGTAITWGKEGKDAASITLDEANGVFDTTIENKTGNLLPSTGGIGTTIFYVMGTILSLGAGVILVAKKRIAR